MLSRLISFLKPIPPQPQTEIHPSFNSGEQLQTLLDSVDSMIYVSDMDTYELLFVNQYGKQQFGEITGEKCWKVLQAGQSGPCPFCTNHNLINLDGTPSVILIWEFQNTISGRWYQCRDRAIRWTNGRLVRLELATDITEGKLYEEQLTRLNTLKGELWDLTRNLEKKVAERTSELTQVQEAFQESNTKLNLLNSITRHDILNQITVLSGYLELSRELASDGEQREYIERAEQAAGVIHSHILFTRLYQDIGVQAPSWKSLQETVGKAIRDVSPVSIKFHLDFTDIEIYTDPLLEKVFYTLIENTIRHGGDATFIRFSHHQDNEGMILIYEDNGIGICQSDKERIFERGYGKNTGFGLYLSREVLAMTGMTIRETGEVGKGARFEITVSPNNHRISLGDE